VKRLNIIQNCLELHLYFTAEKIKEMPEETIDVIATDIFQLENINDLEKYF